MPYFYNTVTQQSVWEAPEGLTKEQIDSLPGASLLKPSLKEVRASHILVKHGGSRRPSSWKEASFPTLPPRSRKLPRGHLFFFFHVHFCFVSIIIVNDASGVGPPLILLFSSYLVAENHAVQGGSDRDLAGIPGRDRDEHGQVWVARAQALGLLVARARRRFGPVWAWADAEAV